MKKYLILLRAKEIIGKAGFFFIGAIFSRPALTLPNATLLVYFGVACLLSGFSIYSFNAGLGFVKDSENPRLELLQSSNRTTILIVGFVLGLLSFVWLYFFFPQLIVPALIVYGIWIAYSIPNGLKEKPLLGMASAFMAQIIHFHIGYLVFADYNVNSIQLSIYFALLFTAGHALHEVIDYEADKAGGLKTSAVYFGERNIFKVSIYIFSAAAIYLLLLTVLHQIDVRLIIPYWIAYGIQMFLLTKVKEEKSGNNLFEFRRRYMTAYLVATIAVMYILYSI